MSDISKINLSKETLKKLIELSIDQLALEFSDQQRMQQQHDFFESSLMRMLEQYKNDELANSESETIVIHKDKDEEIKQNESNFEYYFVEDEQLFASIRDELKSWQIETTFQKTFFNTFLIKKGSIGKYPFYAFVAAYLKSELPSQQKQKLMHLGLRIVIHLSTIKQSRSKQERILAHFRLLFLSKKAVYKNFRSLLDLEILHRANFYSLNDIWNLIASYFLRDAKHPIESDFFQQSTDQTSVKTDADTQFFSLWRSTLNNIQRKRIIVKTKKEQKSVIDIEKPLDGLKKPVKLLAEVTDGADIEPVDIACVELDSQSGLAKFLAGEEKEFSSKVINQIIQDQSWVERASLCNDHFFDQDSGQALFMGLLKAFKETQAKDDKGLLATALLSFLTGENATNFLLKGEKLHPNLEFNRVGHYQIVRWKIELQITESKRMFQNNNLRELQVRIPSPLVQALRDSALKNTAQNRTNIELKIRQVAKEQGLRIGPISLMRIQRHLKFMLEQEWSNQYTANLLARTPSNQATGSYYGQVSKRTAENDYLRYVQYLNSGRDNQDLENELLALPDQNLQFSDESQDASDLIVGSSFIPDKKAVSILLAGLLKKINQPVNIIQQFNAYAEWIWHTSLIFLAGRPVIGVPTKLSKMSLDHNLLIVSDKQQRVNQDNSRILYIHPFLKQALTNYLSYLENFFKKYMVFNPNLYEIWQKIQTSDYGIIHLITTDQMQKKATDSQGYIALQKFNFSLIEGMQASQCQQMSRADVQIKDQKSGKKWADNWHRHFCYSYLINYQNEAGQYLSKTTVNQIMGHEDFNDEFLNPKTSSAALADVTVIKKALDQLLLELGLEQVA